MKIKHTLIVIFILVILTGCKSQYNRGTYDLYLIPEGYEGIIRVTYNVKDAPQLAREGEYDVIPVNENGQYETSNPMFDYGKVIDQYYYVDKEGHRTEIDASCVHIRGTGGYSDSKIETHHTEIEVTQTFCGQDFVLDGTSRHAGFSEGTNSTNATSKSVKLTCLQILENTSCNEFTSQEQEVVEAFEAAIKNAEPMPGILNVNAEYKFQTSGSAQSLRTYHLSLGTDRSAKGLLVDQLDTHKGYEIPIDEANQLRDIIMR